MGVTIIKPPTDYPATVWPPVVQAKQYWADPWQTIPELRLVQCSVSASGHNDSDGCAMARRYGGEVKLPWESTSSEKPPWPSNFGWWVRVCLVGARSWRQVWIGRLSGDAREPEGATAHGPSGVQHYQAYGPTDILRKIAVSKSYWHRPDKEEVQEIGWVPPINTGWPGPYRTTDPDEDDGTYLFEGGPDGSASWTYRQYAEYLLKWFVDESQEGGPAWTLGGQAELLDTLVLPMEFKETQSVAQILARLIPPRLGLDYVVVPNEDGFEIRVLPLAPWEYSFGGQTMPKNPNTVKVKLTGPNDQLSAKLAISNDHGYGRVRVLGERIVVCCSLVGPKGQVDGLDQGSLVAGWAGGDEDAYKNPLGDVGEDSKKSAKDFDAARRDDRFRNVYQHFSASTYWDLHKGTAAPYLDHAGQWVAGEVADYQTAVRETLERLPLFEYFDYSVDPPEPLETPDDWTTPELLKPLVFIGGPINPEAGDEPIRYGTAEQLGIGVSVLKYDWGVHLSCSPNHFLALNHWQGADPSEDGPAYDWEGMVVTLAFESDQRLVFEMAMPEATASDGVLEIYVPDAQFHFLSPHTAVGIDPESGRLLTSGQWCVLRNDAGRLAMTMAGAISRYYATRCRAEITARRLLDWGGLLGQVLSYVEEGGTTHNIQAMITRVEWSVPDGGPPETTLRAGFAQ